MKGDELDPLPTGGAADVAERNAGAPGPAPADGSKPAPAAPIVIAVSGPDAAVHVRYADLVADILAVPEVQERCGGRRARTKRAAPVFAWCRGHVYQFPAKLAVAVGAELIDRGYRVRLGPFSSSILENWDAVDPIVRELIGDPRFARVGGLILADPEIDLPRFFFHLLWLFRQSRVVLAAPPREVGAWREYLTGPHLGRALVTTVNDDRLWRGRRAVLVTTLRELDFCQPDDFDLVLVPDVGPLANRPLTETNNKYGFPRSCLTYPVLREWRVPAFGYLPRDVTELSFAESLTLGSWFGRTLRPHAPIVFTAQGDRVGDEYVART